VIQARGGPWAQMCCSVVVSWTWQLEVAEWEGGGARYR